MFDLNSRSDYLYSGNLGYCYCCHESTILGQGGPSDSTMEMDLEYAQILVNRILSLCSAKGITINKLSEVSGVSQSTLDNLVNGRTFNPRIRTLHRIALDFQSLNDYSFEASADE